MANQVFSIDADEAADGVKMAGVPKSWIEGGNTPDWFTPTIDYGMTDGGILVPKKVDSDGIQEMKQSGSNVEVINSWFDITDLSSASKYSYGANQQDTYFTSSEFIPASVEKYNELGVFVRNDYDGIIDVKLGIFSHSGSSSGYKTPLEYHEESLGAGTMKYYDYNDFSPLGRNIPVIGLGVELYDNSNSLTGYHDIIMIGGV